MHSACSGHTQTPVRTRVDFELLDNLPSSMRVSFATQSVYVYLYLYLYLYIYIYVCIYKGQYKMQVKPAYSLEV